MIKNFKNTLYADLIMQIADLYFIKCVYFKETFQKNISKNHMRYSSQICSLTERLFVEKYEEKHELITVFTLDPLCENFTFLLCGKLSGKTRLYINC